MSDCLLIVTVTLVGENKGLSGVHSETNIKSLPQHESVELVRQIKALLGESIDVDVEDSQLIKGFALEESKEEFWHF